jgi:hypothetical protein
MGWDTGPGRRGLGRPDHIDDLHDWDSENPHHRPFALGADLVFLSAAALDHTAAEVAAGILRDGRAEAVVVTDGARQRVYRRDEALRVPAVSLPGRPVVDTNAGDATRRRTSSLGWPLPAPPPGPAPSRGPGPAAAPARIPAWSTNRRCVD